MNKKTYQGLQVFVRILATEDIVRTSGGGNSLEWDFA